MRTQFSKDGKYKFVNSSLYELRESDTGKYWQHVWAGIASNLNDALKKYNSEF